MSRLLTCCYPAMAGAYGSAYSFPRQEKQTALLGCASLIQCLKSNPERNHEIEDFDSHVGFFLWRPLRS
ncbi:MAG: hypothetical protein ACO214_07095, partial [Hylemonella sp.]